MNSSSAREAIFARAKAALDGELRPRFHEVAEAAQPFVAALVARMATARRVWMVCSDVRSQENLAAEVIAWIPEARLLPELDAAIGHELLPDPETIAERQEILGLLAQEKPVGPLVIHRAQWEQSVPSDLTFTDSVISFAKGDRVILLKAGEKLVDVFLINEDSAERETIISSRRFTSGSLSGSRPPVASRTIRG